MLTVQTEFGLFIFSSYWVKIGVTFYFCSSMFLYLFPYLLVRMFSSWRSQWDSYLVVIDTYYSSDVPFISKEQQFPSLAFTSLCIFEFE